MPFRNKYPFIVLIDYSCPSFVSASMPVSGIYNNLATVLYQMDNRKQTLYYLDKAEALARKENNIASLTRVLGSKGLYYARQNAFDKSERYLTAASTMAEQYKLYTDRHNALINLGDIYLAQGMTEKALTYMHQAALISSNINAFNQNALNVGFGKVYAKMQRYDLAEQFLLKALHRSHELHSDNETREVEELLVEVYAAKGDYNSAYHHIKALMGLKDSLQSRQVTEHVDQLEVKYRTLEKDKELLQKELQINNQEKRLFRQQLWIATGALILTMLLTSIFLYYRHKQKLQRERIRNLQHQQEISQLRAMMKGEEKERGRLARELHDGIGGMLAAIQMNLGSVKDKELADDQPRALTEIIHMVQETATEVRRTAHNLMPDILIRHTLQDALTIYCESINSAGGVQLDIQFNGDTDNLDKALELIIYRIIQELVQNIVKHAYATCAEIQITRHGNRLNLTVEDNGHGFDPTNATNGIGLQNLQFRVQSLGGHISIDSVKGENTTVYIEFDLAVLEKYLTA